MQYFKILRGILRTCVVSEIGKYPSYKLSIMHFNTVRKFGTVFNLNTQEPLSKPSISSQHPASDKRGVKRIKKHVRREALSQSGFWNVMALSTAEEYDLEALNKELLNNEVYQLSNTNYEEDEKDNISECIHAVARYQVDNESRDIYIFREGSFVAWNVSNLELRNILKLIKDFEINGFDSTVVNDEQEIMPYTYSINSKRSFLQNGNICLTQEKTSTDFDKYTFSNVMALSVKLGVWESMLDKYIESIEFITSDLKSGRPINMSRKEVMRKTGELFALRHSINLRSGLLDIPDFYWERENLERLYLHTCNYFNISRRTKVMNDKLNYCVELVDLLSSYLSDQHHIRLEWMIIILIMVEVAFEFIHYGQVFFGSR